MTLEQLDLDMLNKLRGQEKTGAPVVPAPEVITHDCEFCGHCENPEKCVWGVVCPVCKAQQSCQCVEPSNGRVVGLHEERWKFARIQ